MKELPLFSRREVRNAGKEQGEEILSIKPPRPKQIGKLGYLRLFRRGTPAKTTSAVVGLVALVYGWLEEDWPPAYAPFIIAYNRFVRIEFYS